MTTKALEKTIQKLSLEVASLRSFFVDAVINEDKEGIYKPIFIKKVLKLSEQKASFEYRKKGSLLAQIRAL